MAGDNNNGGNLALTAEGEAALAAKPEIVVPNLTNKKRFECGKGRAVVVRVAGAVTLAEIKAAYRIDGSKETEERYICRSVQWGIVSLEGDWGNGPDGKPWSKVPQLVGKTYPYEIVESIPPAQIVEIAEYVGNGAYVTEVQGKD